MIESTKPLETKFFEVRDVMTCMPAIGIKMSRKGRNEAEQFLMGDAGYAPDEVSNVCVLLVFIGINECHYDPYAWRDRTKQVSHNHIYENFDSLESGSVVDVRFILGEAKEPTKSDRFWTPEHD